jgi:DNA-binding MarR family transcriptional regulator
LSAQQHQALLVLKGTPERDFASVGELAERLHLKHHSAVGLVNRLAKRRLVKRIPAKDDRRKVNLLLTDQGEKLIQQLSAAHRDELRVIGPQLRRQLEEIDSER